MGFRFAFFARTFRAGRGGLLHARYALGLCHSFSGRFPPAHLRAGQLKLQDIMLPRKLCRSGPTLHATLTLVPTAVEPMAAIHHADAPFTAGPPFSAVRSARGFARSRRTFRGHHRAADQQSQRARPGAAKPLGRPDGGKVARAQAVSPQVESGNVYLPHPAIAPWVEAFVEECSIFPNGKYDDEVDQMSQALNRLRAMVSPPKYSPPMPRPPRRATADWT